MVDVADERVERGHALAHAALDHAPLARGQHARDQVERQDAVDGVLVGIDCEGDALVEQLDLGDLGAAGELGGVHGGQARGDELDRGIVDGAVHHLAEEAAFVVAVEKAVHVCFLTFVGVASAKEGHPTPGAPRRERASCRARGVIRS